MVVILILRLNCFQALRVATTEQLPSIKQYLLG